MTLSPEQAAFVEAYPFALSSYITEDMQDRIAERIKATVQAEGHRRAMPASKQPTAGEYVVMRASVSECLATIMAGRVMTHEQLVQETGLTSLQVSNGLMSLFRSNRLTRTKVKGQFFLYAMVTQ